jgi:hypothetical protein
MGHVDPCHLNTVVVLIVAALYMCHLGFPTGYSDFATQLCAIGIFCLYHFVISGQNPFWQDSKELRPTHLCDYYRK